MKSSSSTLGRTGEGQFHVLYFLFIYYYLFFWIFSPLYTKIVTYCNYTLFLHTILTSTFMFWNLIFVAYIIRIHILLSGPRSDQYRKSYFYRHNIILKTYILHTFTCDFYYFFSLIIFHFFSFFLLSIFPIFQASRAVSKPHGRTTIPCSVYFICLRALHTPMGQEALVSL